MNNNLEREGQGTFGLAEVLFDQEKYSQICQMAEAMSGSNFTIPTHFRGNFGDCMSVIVKSLQWGGLNPWDVASKTSLMNGSTLAYDAQLVTAVINSSPLLESRLKPSFEGDWSSVMGKCTQGKNAKGHKTFTKQWKPEAEEGLSVTVSGTLKGQNDPTTLTVKLNEVVDRVSSNWVVNPRQQLVYLVEKQWARMYAPDIILGVYTPDEKPFDEPLNNEQPSTIESSEEALTNSEIDLDEEHQSLIDQIEAATIESHIDVELRPLISRLPQGEARGYVIDRASAKLEEIQSLAANEYSDAEYPEANKDAPENSDEEPPEVKQNAASLKKSYTTIDGEIMKAKTEDEVDAAISPDNMGHLSEAIQQQLRYGAENQLHVISVNSQEE